MPKVHFINEMITVEVPAGTSLREVARAQGVELYRGMWTHLNCLGNGICGRCRLWVLSSAPLRPKLRERLHRTVHGEMRLACQVRIFDDLSVRTRPLGRATVRSAATEAAPIVPSYRPQADQRLREAREAEAEAARKAAQKKAAEEKAAAEKAAAEKKAATEKAAAEKKAAQEKAASATTGPASAPTSASDGKSAE